MIENKNNLTSLINTDLHGDKKGICIICGRKTKNGFNVCFSNSFVSWNYLYAGNCFCPQCKAFFSEQVYRRKSWVATKDGFVFGKKELILTNLLNPPEPPFFIYYTRGGQRQGWISALKYVNHSKQKYFISCDFNEVPIWTTFEEVHKLYDLVAKLREKKIGKNILISGEYGMFVYKKAMNEGWAVLLDNIKKHVKKPIWEVLVYAAE